MRAEFVRRIHMVSLFVLAFAVLLGAKLYFVQIVHGSDFSDRADRQYVRPSYDLYNRGNIFFEDKYGKIHDAATLKTGYTVAIKPKLILDEQEVFDSLNSIIDLDEESYFFRVGKKDDPYEEIAHRINTKEADQIAELDIDGVYLYKDRWRYYPGNTLAAQTLGFIGYDGNERSGRYGLERYYDDILTRDTSSVYVNFFAEIFSNIKNTVNDENRVGDVVTSIDPAVQLFLENTLAGIEEKWNSKLSGGIIVNPKTGSIYALAVSPRFDVNTFSEVEDSSVYGNPLVESIYEMGSIIKPLTMAVGIDSGAVSADTTYYDKGYLKIDGYTISNFDGKGRGKVNMQEVLSQSLNTGAVYVAEQVGSDVFKDYMDRLGIGEETGIDLPNESAGLVSNLDSPRFIEYATASFGQGFAITPIATVKALSALANGGITITPHVAKKISYTSGLSKKVSYPIEEQVFSKETTDEVTRMLVEVVDKALRGGTVKLERYSVAAKTGTAQIAKINERGYYDDRFLHSFFGYVPAYNPEFLIFLYTVEPKEVRYASETLTYPFMDIVEYLINHYEIPPDR